MTNLIGAFSPYLAVFVLMVCFIFPYQRLNSYHQDSIKWACLLIFVVFFGLHGNVGDDYEAYKYIYENITSFSIIDVEPGFLLFAWCFKMLHLPYWCFVLGCSCIINGLLFVFLWRTKENLPFVLCIFFAMSGIILEISYLRSTISLMLFANSLAYLQSKNTKAYLTLNVIGLLFHYSSIFYFLLYFFLDHKFTRKSITIVAVCGFVMSIFRFPILSPLYYVIEVIHSDTLSKLSTYYLSSNMYLGFSLGTVERLFTLSSILLFYDKLTDNTKGVVAVNSYMLYFLFYSFLCAYALLGIRMSNMFVYAYWLLWPMIIRCINNRRLQVSVLTLMLGYMVVRIVGLGNLSSWQYNMRLLTD